MPQEFCVDLCLLVLLFFACLYDLSQRRIPNRLVLAGLAAALALHLLLMPAIALLSNMLAGFAVGLCMFLPLYMLRAMAAGDVKLMATVGAFTGPLLGFEIALVSCCAGGLLGLGMILAKGKARVAAANIAALVRPLFLRMGGVQLAVEPMPHPSVGGMPYALAITTGTLTMLWIRHT